MAFPTVAARTETPLSSSTSLTVNFTQTTGHRVVIFLALNDTAQALSSVGDGFTNLTAANATFHILTKVLVGTEGGNVVVTVGSATKGTAVAYNVAAHNSATAPEFSTVATGTSTSPNPGSLTPTGGAKDYLWIAAFRQNGEEADDDTWCTAAPSTPSAFGTLTQTTSGTAGLPATNGSVASADLASNAASMDPGAFTVAQSLAWRAYTVAIHPIVDTTVTPGLATLTLTRFTPTVTATANRLVTPGLATLATTRFTPTVLSPRLVTPGVASLALTRFTPTVLSPRLVTPGVASLALTRFTPVVTLGTTITPVTATLTTTRFAPTVLTPRLSTPGTATLALTPFAPAVATPRLATPTTATLTLTGFVPTVTTTAGAGVTVTPGVAALTLTGFTPSVTAGGGVVVVPGVATLTTTGFAPTVLSPRLIVPGTAALLLTAYTPLVRRGSLATPGTATLILTVFAPSVLGQAPTIGTAGGFDEPVATATIADLSPHSSALSDRGSAEGAASTGTDYSAALADYPGATAIVSDALGGP